MAATIFEQVGYANSGASYEQAIVLVQLAGKRAARRNNSGWCGIMEIIGRAGASPPSRSAGAPLYIYIYIINIHPEM